MEVNSVWITQVASFDVAETNYPLRQDDLRRSRVHSTVHEQLRANLTSGMANVDGHRHLHPPNHQRGRLRQRGDHGVSRSEGAGVALVCPDEVLNEPQPMALAQGWKPGQGVDILWEGSMARKASSRTCRL